MSIKNLIPGRKVRAELAAMRTDFEQLKEVAKLQALVIDDITTAAAGKQTYVANAYQTYREVINEISKKYEGKAEWGVLQTGNIIDVRSAFIAGEGIAVGPADPANKKFKESNEFAFIKDFLLFNDLDREMSQELVKEAEIEGCVLLQLSWDEKDKNVSVRFRSRVEDSYEIVTGSGDYFDYTEAKWTPAGASAPKSIEKNNFVYSRFGGRIRKVNEPYPKVGKALNEIDGLSKALRDWREINHLFTSPVPVIEAEDEAAAKAIDSVLGNLNWKIRKQMILAKAKLAFIQPNLEGGSAALEKEIVTLAKMISGTTGVPVHFLGLPELMSNRATADNLMDLVVASTSKERQVWIGTWEEAINKGIALYNSNSPKTPLKPGTFKVSIPFISAEAWARIKDIWLPVFLADGITSETFLSQIPGINVEAEVAALQAGAEKRLRDFTASPLNRGKNKEEI